MGVQGKLDEIFDVGSLHFEIQKKGSYGKTKDKEGSILKTALVVPSNLGDGDKDTLFGGVWGADTVLAFAGSLSLLLTPTVDHIKIRERRQSKNHLENLVLVSVHRFLYSICFGVGRVQ